MEPEFGDDPRDKQLAWQAVKIGSLEAEIARLKSERLTPKKLDGPPTEPGWYWRRLRSKPHSWRDEASATWQMHSVDAFDISHMAFDPWEWYGPLPEPTEEG